MKIEVCSREETAARLKSELRIQQITQKNLADRLGVDYQTVHRMVNGKTPIYADLLYKMSVILGKPMEEFVRGYNEE